MKNQLKRAAAGALSLLLLSLPLPGLAEETPEAPIQIEAQVQTEAPVQTEAAPEPTPPQTPEAQEQPIPTATEAPLPPEAVIPEAVTLEPQALEPAATPEPLAPEARETAPVQESAAPTAAATAAPLPTRAPYIEVFARIDGIDCPLPAGDEAALAFSADYFADGKKIAASAAKGSGTEFDQALARECVRALWLTFDNSFLAVFAPTDSKVPRAHIVESVSEKNFERFGLVRTENRDGQVLYLDKAETVYPAGTPFNAGRCLLEGLPVRGDIPAGEYAINAEIHWIPLDSSREVSVPFSFKVRVTVPETGVQTKVLNIPAANAATEEASVDAADEILPSPSPAASPSATVEPEPAPTASEAPTEPPAATPEAEPAQEPDPSQTPQAASGFSARPEKIYTTQGKVLPGSGYNVQFGIELLQDGTVRCRTNASGQPEAKYSQAVTRTVSALWVELDPETFWSIFAADGAETPRADVVFRVDPASAASAGLQQDRRDGNLFRDSYDNAYATGDAYNNGFASFYGLTLRDDLAAGEYTQKGTIQYILAGENTVNTDPFSFTVTVGAVEKPAPGGDGYGYGGGGGGYGGGGDAVATPAPSAKLIIEKMETKPLRPRPGDEFEIRLRLRNTSAGQKIQNIDLTYTTENNVIRPANGLNRVHLDEIPAGGTVDVILDVIAGVEISGDLVHMEVAFDYEDKDAAAKQATQEVFLRMERVQRMDLDEPVLPNDMPVAQESFTIKVNVTNKGRNVLDNVSARVVSDSESLMTSGSWYGGNLESGAQKTAELELIPIESGDYEAKLEVSYEDALTGEAIVETRDIYFSAMEAESYDDYYDESYEEYGDMPEDKGAETANIGIMERLSNLPPWLYAALGGGAVLLFTLLISLVRRIRRKALEDDEMD